MLKGGSTQAVAGRLRGKKRWSGAMRWAAPILGIAVLAGFGVLAYLRQHHQEQAEQAAGIYAEVMDTLRQGQAIQALSHAGRLIEQYSGRPEASLAALATAPAALALQSHKAASNQLHFAVAHARDQGIMADARLQLARLSWNDGQLQAALEVLKDPPKGFEAQFLALRGDVFLAQGRDRAAREAWSQALQYTKDPGLRSEIQEKKAVWP